jgi:hypothetical protein
MYVPDGNVDDLAKGLIKDYPKDALDRAALMSNMLFLLGHAEKSKKWLLVRASIEKIQAGAR